MITFYSKKEYQQIARLFNLGEVKSASQLHRGFGMAVKAKLMTTQGSFVVSKNILSEKKDITSKSQASLQYEIDMLQTVRGMPVVVFLKSKDGKYIEKVGDGWVTVYPFVSGTPPAKMNASIAYSLGAFLGEFHRRSKKFTKELRSRRKYYDLSDRVLRLMEPYALRQKNSHLQEVVQDIKMNVRKNRPLSGLPVGPIHVDLGPYNQLFKGNTLQAVIDFGNFYRGPFMVDVGKTVMLNFCSHGELNGPILRQFLEGYMKERKLTMAEKRYIPQAILYAIYSHIWVDLYHVSINYVPERYALYLVKNYLPVAKRIERDGLFHSGTKYSKRNGAAITNYFV